MAERPSGTNSQRTLAAIVFTDAVSFSARMQKDEVGTLKILQRDFAEMRRICAEHEGSVLKTTGDGLLMTFSSAVHAVACALAMQRQFAAEVKELTASKFLLHRIGIHIGDIIVQDQDVMGDGVNIASRLQAEAEPGGICISQTVYDVVKNKIELQAVHLGPRDLKNISQAIPVYRLLLEAQNLQPGASRPPMPAPAAQAAAPKSSNKTLLIGGIAAALLLVFAAGIMVSRRTPRGVAGNNRPAAAAPSTAAVVPAPTPAATPPATPANVAPAQGAARQGGAGLNRGGRGRAALNAEATGAPAPATPAPAVAAVDPAAELARRRDLTQTRAQYLEKYDFAGLAKAAAESGETGAARGQAQGIMVAAEQMAVMKNWLEPTLRRYTRQNPLTVPDLLGAGQAETRVFLAPDNKLIQIMGPTIQPRDWAAIAPAAMGNIIVSALRDARPPASREVVQGAVAFSRAYNLAAMEPVLIPLLPGGQQPRAGRAAGNNLPARGR